MSGNHNGPRKWQRRTRTYTLGLLPTPCQSGTGAKAPSRSCHRRVTLQYLLSASCGHRLLRPVRSDALHSQVARAAVSRVQRNSTGAAVPVGYHLSVWQLSFDFGDSNNEGCRVVKITKADDNVLVLKRKTKQNKISKTANNHSEQGTLRYQ